MKTALNILLFICISPLFMSCSAHSVDNSEENFSSDSLHTIIVNFEYGEDFSTSKWKNIYAIWMEDTASGFLQNIFICQKLITGGVTGTVLPFWKYNKQPKSSSSEIDAVTSATMANTDFSVSTVLKDSTIRNFVLYFEVDRSFEPNDWFSDQPALLYAANINLDDDTSEYELLPIGWTPNESTQNVIPNTPFGKLQKEMRYITNHKDGSTFGDADERSSTRMVKKITVTIIKPVTTNIITTKTDNFSISLYPNPANKEINIKSKGIIEDVAIINLQGQTILHVQPKRFETTFVLNRAIVPKGIYFAQIKTPGGISTHKILISK